MRDIGYLLFMKKYLIIGDYVYKRTKDDDMPRPSDVDDGLLEEEDEERVRPSGERLRTPSDGKGRGRS